MKLIYYGINMIVCKFGGSSVASPEGANKIKYILTKNKNRKIIVVSAIGKCVEQNKKITDCLFELYYSLNNKIKKFLLQQVTLRRVEKPF